MNNLCRQYGMDGYFCTKTVPLTIVPVDFSVLTPGNQKVFLDFVKKLPESQQSKIIIMR
ncbi:hypothetical protein [Serratia plymuthica]|uniref:hypothetical protein n=1 Tax=Serratia plymuthica TaxID=82996 RepID=UPI001419CC3A|nr:hypothetical protein [Serratia plymuthica]